MNPRRHNARFIVASMVAVLACLLTASPSLAHLFTSGHPRHWYFHGATLDDQGHDSDPLNLLFFKGDRQWEPDQIEDLLHKEWDGMDKLIFACNHHQRVAWTKADGRVATSDKNDMAMSTHAGRGCFGSGYHIRGWDDQEHAHVTSNHGPEGQWVIAGVHHEDFNHDINYDWDIARWGAIRNLPQRCHEKRWRLVPSARGEFHGYNNSGWMARVSRKRDDSAHPCRGA